MTHEKIEEGTDLLDDIPEHHWSLDRRIPIALIISILLQAFAIIWWASAMEARVGELERVMTQLAHDGTPAMRERVGRLEEQIIGQQDDIHEIKDGINDIRRQMRRR